MTVKRKNSFFHAIKFFWLVVIFISCDKPFERKTSDSDTRKKTQKNTLAQNGINRNDDMNFHQILKKAKKSLENKQLINSRKIVLNGLKNLKNNNNEKNSKYAALTKLLGDISLEKGNLDEAMKHYIDALALFRVLKNDEGYFSTLLSVTRFEITNGNYHKAFERLEEASKLLHKVKKPELSGEYLMLSGRLYSRKLEYDKSYDDFKNAALIFKKAALKKKEAEAYMLAAFQKDHLEHARTSKRLLRLALEIFEEIYDSEASAKVLQKLASSELREKNYRRAEKLLKRAYNLYRKMGNTGMQMKLERQINSLPK